MKYLLSSGALLLTMLLLWSCSDDFLTREPLGQFNTATTQSKAGVEGLLIGAYALIDGTGLAGQAAWNNEISNWVFGGIASDNGLKGTDAGDQPEQSFIERYEFLTINGHVNNKWRGLYLGVARANDVINTVQGEIPGLTEDERAQIIAEARFLRGIYHFEAQKMWRFPLYVGNEISDVLDVNSTLAATNRDMQTIWPQIEADFQAAADVLPQEQGQVGRATSWAAKAFLAKAKLYQGWNEDGSANSAKLSEAKPILDEIVNSGAFSLVPRFSDNFKVGTRNNDESIFEVQFAVSSANADGSTQGVALAHPYIAPWGCCGFYQASQNLVNAYQTSEDGLPLLGEFDDQDVEVDLDPGDGPDFVTDVPLDPRLDHTVGRPGILYKNFQVHHVDFVRDISYAGPFSSMKHVAEPEGTGVSGWVQLSANNYRLMRYSMILLWLAEVEVEVGDLDRARELVNMIRTRAANEEDFVPGAVRNPDSRQEYTVVVDESGAPVPSSNYVIGTYDDSWTDQDVARQAVRFESRLEFALEGHRYFDLQRWRIQDEVLNAYLESESQHRTYLRGQSFDAPTDEYYPIPIQAIDRSILNGEPSIIQDPNY